MTDDLGWTITIGVLCANIDVNDRHILTTAMKRHPNAPWALAFKGLHAQGYNLAWAMDRFDGSIE